MNGKSDSELMHELKEGQKAALDVIMERWEVPIKAYIYRYTQAQDWVDELAQETFVKVYINASTFDTNRRFSPWIYTIATNLCRNWKRWRSRHPSLSQQTTSNEGSVGLEERLVDNQTPFIEKLDQKERCLEVKKAISTLPDPLKTSLILYYYQGLSYQEIAETLQCSTRGIETRLYRAKRILQQKLLAEIHA